MNVVLVSVLHSRIRPDTSTRAVKTRAELELNGSFVSRSVFSGRWTRRSRESIRIQRAIIS